MEPTKENDGLSALGAESVGFEQPTGPLAPPLLARDVGAAPGSLVPPLVHQPPTMNVPGLGEPTGEGERVVECVARAMREVDKVGDVAPVLLVGSGELDD